MYLTITTTHNPATDLGYLLHKRPGKLHSVSLSFGRALVFYPEATESRCTAALLLEVDPVELVRKPGGPSGEGGLLDQYVNDRPYVSSSFTSVALARAFGTALGGRSKTKQELADAEIPLEIRIAVLPCRGGEAFLRRLFEPLGYVRHRQLVIRSMKNSRSGARVAIGPSLSLRRSDCKMSCSISMSFLPVLDDEKHYWVGKDEVEKLLRRGEGWLASHPEREEITRRYLKYQHRLMREALARLTEEEEDPDEVAEQHAAEEIVLEERISLNQQRLGSVLAALRQSGAKRVSGSWLWRRPAPFDASGGQLLSRKSWESMSLRVSWKGR